MPLFTSQLMDNKQHTCFRLCIEYSQFILISKILTGFLLLLSPLMLTVYDFLYWSEPLLMLSNRMLTLWNYITGLNFLCCHLPRCFNLRIISVGLFTHCYPILPDAPCSSLTLGALISVFSPLSYYLPL